MKLNMKRIQEAIFKINNKTFPALLNIAGKYLQEDAFLSFLEKTFTKSLVGLTAIREYRLDTRRNVSHDLALISPGSPFESPKIHGIIELKFHGKRTGNKLSKAKEDLKLARYGGIKNVYVIICHIFLASTGIGKKDKKILKSIRFFEDYEDKDFNSPPDNIPKKIKPQKITGIPPYIGKNIATAQQFLTARNRRKPHTFCISKLGKYPTAEGSKAVACLFTIIVKVN